MIRDRHGRLLAATGTARGVQLRQGGRAAVAVDGVGDPKFYCAPHRSATDLR
jgi:hypothetical protein